MKVAILSCLVCCAFVAGAKVNSSTTKSTIIMGAKTESSVVGVGTTYTEAFKDARAKLPAGKSHRRVTSKKLNGKFYVTLYYYAN